MNAGRGKADQRQAYLSLMLIEALEDENQAAVESILANSGGLLDPSRLLYSRTISPLHYVCGMSNTEWAKDLAQRFLEMGANPNVCGEDNMTPMHVAALYGRVEIVRLLLDFGGQIDVQDDFNKTPYLYAIQGDHFEVFELLRNHYLKEKQKSKRDNSKLQNSNSILSSTQFENSLLTKHSSSPKPMDSLRVPAPTNFATPSANDLFYNNDPTSPYYINITHRRNKPQPKFPLLLSAVTPTKVDESEHCKGTCSTPSTEPAPALPDRVNIFALTRENLHELHESTKEAEKSRRSLIDSWREKVQHSRARKSILAEFNDIDKMIDSVMENDLLSFSNIILKEKEQTNKDEESDSGACASSADEENIMKRRSPPKSMSLGKIIQQVAHAPLLEVPDEGMRNERLSLKKVNNSPKSDNESSYLTVPDLDKERTFVVHSPSQQEYFLQMAEEYVHTDEENGLVFYEKKLLSNPGNKVAFQRLNQKEGECHQPNPMLDLTETTHSTDVTIPVDYETDALRAELTTFGEPPGPITESTKRLYIKRLVKYKRRKGLVDEVNQKLVNNKSALSVELLRTMRSMEGFKNINDYMQFDKQSLEYFNNHNNRKQLREGHLKHSFIYMLIDPRISCNLPGESVFMDKLDVWKCFNESIFYVGKGKSSRPYSHLYDAMKAHMRLHNNKEGGAPKGQPSIRKQRLNLDQLKSPTCPSSESRKIARILDIWANELGVVCLHVFHNIVPAEAYTREAAMIDALSLNHLTNIKRGDYYGPARAWPMKQKKYLGIALLYRAMQMYLAEGESQLAPSDLI